MSNEKRKAGKGGKESFQILSPQKKTKQDAKTNDSLEDDKALCYAVKIMCKSFISRKQNVQNVSDFFVSPKEYAVEELYPDVFRLEDKQVWASVQQKVITALSTKNDHIVNFINSTKEKYDNAEREFLNNSYVFNLEEANAKNLFE